MIKCNSCEYCDVNTNSDEAYCEVNDGEQIILYRGQCRPRWCPRMKGANDYERAIEQMEHDMLYEPTYNEDDGSM